MNDHSKTSIDNTDISKRIWYVNAFISIPKAVVIFSQTLNVFGMAVLGVLAALTVADVLGRAVFNKPILGTFELTEYMLTIIVFSSISWCAVKGGHIKVDILVSHLKPRVQMILATLTHLISLGLLITITWQCFLEATVMMDMGKASTILNVPAYPFYWIMTIGLFVLCLQLLVEFMRYLNRALKL